jgi:hypothetical protein
VYLKIANVTDIALAIQEGEIMIIDHSTYNMTHGKMDDYLRRYEAIGLPLQREHLGELVGFFVSDIGPLNQVVHLWAYDSIADREIRREQMAADPRWHFGKATTGCSPARRSRSSSPPLSPPSPRRSSTHQSAVDH